MLMVTFQGAKVLPEADNPRTDQTLAHLARSYKWAALINICLRQHAYVEKK